MIGLMLLVMVVVVSLDIRKGSRHTPTDATCQAEVDEFLKSDYIRQEKFVGVQECKIIISITEREGE